MQLVVNGITINLASSDYAVTVGDGKTVIEFTGNPNAAPDEATPEAIAAEPTTPVEAVPPQGARRRLADVFGSDSEPPTSPLTARDRLDTGSPSPRKRALDTPEPPSPLILRARTAVSDPPAPIGTIRRVRQRRSKDSEGDMLMLVTGGTTLAPTATWLYSPGETVAHSIFSAKTTATTGAAVSESDDPDTDDDDTGLGVWAFSDYAVVQADYDDSVPHRGDIPLCTHFVATDDNADVVSVRPLPKTYLDYVRSFDCPDTRSPIEIIAENVYDAALMRGRQDPETYAQVLELIEAGTELRRYDGRGTCAVCGMGGRPASYKLGPMCVGSTCADYIRLACRAFEATKATANAIVEPLVYLRNRSAATAALQDCAEV